MNSAQEMFETISKHLFEQGEQSKDKNDPEKCLYRGPNGNKCSAGFMIPDDKYRKEIDEENLNINEVNRIFPDTFSSSVKENMELLLQLQYTHDDDDNWVSSKAMRFCLIRVGKSFKLNVSFLDNLSFKGK